MIGRVFLVVLGLGFVAGAGFSQAQEAAAPAKGQAKSAPAARGTEWQAAGTQGAVAAGGREAVAAGLGILKDGGNAADAGAATILALSVTDSRSFCFGGEVPILVFDARHQGVTVIAGQAQPPAWRRWTISGAPAAFPPRESRPRPSPPHSTPA